MEKKPVYESPKVSRLDEKESLLGQQQEMCRSNGSGDACACFNVGNSAGTLGEEGASDACNAGMSPNRTNCIN